MAQDYNDKFPIKTATACNSKWTWSTIWLTQKTTSSCHRVSPVSLDPDNFSNFHNLPKKIEDRQLMLEGQWPSGGCEYCQHIEQSGGHSDRMHNNSIGGYVPKELKINPTAVNVTPRIVEIFAENTCNFSCIYCNEELSSQIQFENRKFGHDNRIIKSTLGFPDTTKLLDAFLDWLDNNIQELARLHLLGGETFIQHDLLTRVFEIIERRPNPNLQLNIFSNFNVPERYWNSYTNKIKDYAKSGHIERLDLTCSIDCWGPQAEYVRHGLDLNRLESYLAWSAEQSEDWLYLNINQTISSMTIKTMPELIEKIKQYSKHRRIGQYFEFLNGYDFQHPEIYDYSVWSDDMDRILATLPNETFDQQEVFPRMIGIQKHLQARCQTDAGKITQLHNYLDELDRRRGTNWRNLFPHLII